MPHFEVVLNGGLGNQLFGWALGTAASIETGLACSFNASQIGERGYQLSRLGIDATYETPLCKDPYRSSLMKRVRNKLGFSDKEFRFAEQKFCFDARFLRPYPGVSLYGYFQSWKYFSQHEDIIRSALTTFSKPSTDFLDLSQEFAEKQYVALHVRRGDYLLKESFHGLLSRNYFENARDFFLQQYPDAKFVLFSDSPTIAIEILPWAEQSLQLSHISSPLEIMILMSKASGIIGSNSSFSWWAAYLMRNNQLKIFPEPWFATNSLDTSDVVPLTWKTMPSEF